MPGFCSGWSSFQLSLVELVCEPDQLLWVEIRIILSTDNTRHIGNRAVIHYLAAETNRNKYSRKKYL